MPGTVFDCKNAGLNAIWCFLGYHHSINKTHTHIMCYSLASAAVEAHATWPGNPEGGGLVFREVSVKDNCELSLK